MHGKGGLSQPPAKPAENVRRIVMPGMVPELFDVNSLYEKF